MDAAKKENKYIPQSNLVSVCQPSLSIGLKRPKFNPPLKNNDKQPCTEAAPMNPELAGLKDHPLLKNIDPKMIETVIFNLNLFLFISRS